MDSSVVLWLNSWAGRSTTLDGLVKILASDYCVPVLGTLCLLALWFYGEGAKRRLNQIVTIRGALAIGFANLMTILINQTYFRPRPFTQMDIHLLFYRPTDSSFPANAAAVGFAIATAVFITHRRLGLALYLLAFLWAFARVFAGVHYPTDVLAGAAIGVTGALGAVLVSRILGKPIDLLLSVGRLFFLA